MPDRLAPGAGPNAGQFQGRGRLMVFPWWIHLVEALIVVMVVVLLVVLVVWATRPRRLAPPATMVTPALTELDLRYARGEIGHKDYLQRRANLLGQAPPVIAPAPVAEPPPTEAPS